MRTPLAAWRGGARWPLAAATVVAALVIAIGVCEAIGWPFLVAPVEHRLAAALNRRVVFGSDPDKPSAVRIGLVGSVRVHAGSIEIGAPAWSDSPYMLLARDARMTLGYLDLWRAVRGRTLNIRDLEAAALELDLSRRADGRASWQLGRHAEEGEHEASPPTFGRLVVGDGHLRYADAILPADIDARFSLSDGSSRAVPAGVPPLASAPPSAAGVGAGSASAGERGIVIRAGGAAGGASAPTAESVRLAEGESGLRLKATGDYRKLPLRIDLRTAGVLAFLDDGDDARAQPFSLRALVGRTDLAFDGSTRNPLRFRGLKGRFRISGPSLANVGDALGITLPTTPAFKTYGTLVKDGDVWKAVFEEATIGSSRLDGAFTYDHRPKVPLLAGRLRGQRLLLADLGPAVGAGSGSGKAVGPRSGRVIPDRHFDLPSLRAMNANVLIDIGTFDPGTDVIEPLRPARAHLLLAEGVLTIADFEGVTAQGKLAGYLQLDGRADKALWTADLRLLGVDLAQWLRLKRANDAPPYLSGKLDALVKVKGSGRSAAEILGSLEGDLRMHMREAAVSHFAVEVAGIDVAQALGVKLKGDDALPIQCNVVDLDIKNGVAKPKILVLSTRDSTIWGDGTVSLRDESLDLTTVVAPKDISPLTLRTPVHVKGPLGAPKVSLEMDRVVAKGVAAGLLALLNPLAAIVPFIDPGDKKLAAEADSECAAVAHSSGAIAPPVQLPKSTRVPPPAVGASAVAEAPASSAARR